MSRSRLPILRERGQTLVEFALVVPLLIFLLMILFDFGRAIYAYNTISEAARNGARVTIVNQYTPEVQTYAAQRAVALGLTAGQVTVGPDVPGNASCSPTIKITCVYKVTVTYSWSAITPIIGNVLGAINLTSTSKVPVESVCTTGPGSCPIP